MHGQIMGFLQGRKEHHPGHFVPGVRVLELGSRDINGSPRQLFDRPGFYLGIDCHGGPGVDVVGVVHEVLASRKLDLLDVVVSTEMLEHDPYWQQTLQAAVPLLRPGGLFMLSCASRCRPAHHLEDSPVPGHYGGLDPADLLPVLEPMHLWTSLEGWLVRNDLDTLVAGVVGDG